MRDSRSQQWHPQHWHSWRWYSGAVDPQEAQTIPVPPPKAARHYLTIQRVGAGVIISALRPPPLPSDIDG